MYSEAISKYMWLTKSTATVSELDPHKFSEFKMNGSDSFSYVGSTHLSEYDQFILNFLRTFIGSNFGTIVFLTNFKDVPSIHLERFVFCLLKN